MAGTICYWPQGRQLVFARVHLWAAGAVSVRVYGRWSVCVEVASEITVFAVGIAGGANPSGDVFLQSEQILETGPVYGDSGIGGIGFGGCQHDLHQGFAGIQQEIGEAGALNRRQVFRQGRAFAAEHGSGQVIGTTGFGEKAGSRGWWRDVGASEGATDGHQFIDSDAEAACAVRDLFSGAEQQRAAAQLQVVTGTHHVQLHRVPIDSAAVCAVQVCEDDVAMIFLQLGVQATDAFVIQLHIVDFLTPDRDRWLQVAVNPTSLKTLQDRQCDERHIMLRLLFWRGTGNPVAVPRGFIRKGRKRLSVPLSTSGPPEKGDQAWIFPKLVSSEPKRRILSVGKNCGCGNRHAIEVWEKAGK